MESAILPAARSGSQPRATSELRLALIAVLALASTPAPAQRGDRTGEVQAPPPAHLLIPPAPVLTPEQALGSFSLPAGFRIEVVASEPLIRDPVALTFDPAGRLWVAEMPRYNEDYQDDLAPVTGQHRQPLPAGRIVILADADGDGRMDHRTVFLDDLHVPRSILVLHDGVLIADPPHLWFCRDRDGDGRADEKVLVTDDFGNPATPYSAPNGLLWGLDNRIHNAAYGFILRREGESWHKDPVRPRGQWGLSQDDYGRLFFNTNSWHLRADLYPAHYYPVRPAAPARLPVDVSLAPDQNVYPARPTPGVNRGYREDYLRPDGSLRSFTAACGPEVYRGDQFPAEYYGNVFVAAPEANLVRRSLLFGRDGQLRADVALPGHEFLTSTDERFRPVSLYTGPDGALYIVDLYRGVLEASGSITTYLRDQIVARGLHVPFSGLGRIYRVVHDAGSRSLPPDLTRAGASELVTLLGHPNGWVRDRVHQQLVERVDRSVVPALRARATGPEAPHHRLRAVWILRGLQALDRATLLAALRDPAPEVRQATLRLSEAWLAGVTADPEVVAVVLTLADDPRPEVRLQAALTFGSQDNERFRAALRALLVRHGDQRYLADSILVFFAGREPELLARLLGDDRFSTAPWNRELVAHLAARQLSAESATADSLLDFARRNNLPPALRAAVLQGLLDGSTSRTGAVRRISVRDPAIIAPLRQDPDPAVRALAGHVTARLAPGTGTTPTAVTAAPPSDPVRLASGQRHYAICAACHQAAGQGAPGVAPPLLGSEWVTGSEDSLARIVLHGKEGTTGYPGMPPFGGLDDNALADLLTFLRQSWGHRGSAVSPATVARVRQATAGRSRPWTEVELRSNTR